MKRRRVLLESPFGSPDPSERACNLAYARLAMLDSLRRGEAPIASHLLYPQCLREDVPAERQLGIDAGLVWGQAAKATVVYCDRGLSDGVLDAIQDAQHKRRRVEMRWLFRRRSRT